MDHPSRSRNRGLPTESQRSPAANRARFLASIFAFFLGTALLGSAAAQDRSLSWDALTVHAKLDAQGMLHVTERHAMVFDGAWNGGERRFQLRSWQGLDVRSLSEVDPTTQARTLWVEDDLDRVGEYQRNGNVLRWRARMPDDPAFASTRKTYEIEYSIAGTLIEEDGAYRFEHNLAFPERDGVIRVFDAVLEVDPVWEADIATRWHEENLQPGESVLVNATFRFSGTQRPDAVASLAAVPSPSALPALRFGLLAVVLLLVLVHGAALIRRERARGRFEPPLPVESIDEAWLQANLFDRPAEVVGAAWDLDTSASEVSALLARLAQQGALKSEVKTTGSGWFKRETLHLELLCERDRLLDHERELIDALFFNGSRTTDTNRIRERYSKSGFTPAALIQKGIEQQLPAVFANKVAVPAWARWLTALCFIAALGTTIASAIQSTDSAEVVVPAIAAMAVVWVFGLIFGFIYRKNVHKLKGRLARALVCVGLLCGVLAFMLIAGVVAVVPLGAIALTLTALTFVNMIFNVMRTRETPEALALRRKLGSARAYFERELSAEQPRLKDEWFPYLLAFGLGPQIDRWFKAFGGQSTAIRRGVGGGATSIGSRSAGSSTWTGGGGTFGGAGASGTWASAVGSIASGVAKPSSNSSGRSSGGGSSRSSGGGGGGGW